MTHVYNSGPEYGESALVLVPKVEFQHKWQAILGGGSAIVGYKVSGHPLYVVYYLGNKEAGGDSLSYRERASTAYEHLARRSSKGKVRFVEEGEFEVIGQMTDKAFDVQLTESVSDWMEYDPAFQQAAW